MEALVHLRKKLGVEGVEGAGGSNLRRSGPGDVAVGHASRWRGRSRLAIARATEEDDGGDDG